MATDPECRTGADPRLKASQSASTVNSPHQSNDTRRAGARALGLARRDKVPRSSSGPTPPEAVTLPPKRELPSKGAYDRRGTGRGIRLGGKCTHQAEPPRAGVREDPHAPRRPTPVELNSASLLNGPIRLPLNGFTYS